MRGWIGITERGNNRGPEIDTWNRYVKNPVGSPYCAASVSYALHLAGALSPKPSGLAQALVDKSTFRATEVIARKKRVAVGDIPVWQQGESIRGHTGVVERVVDYNTIVTIEANTTSGSSGNQRDGGGVYRRTRDILPYSYFGIRKFTRPRYQ